MFKPLFNYTSIPLDTTQCFPFTSTCSAMQAVTENLNNVRLRSTEQTCSLSVDCLSITCVNNNGQDSVVIKITLSPCEYAVTFSVSSDSLEGYNKTFNQSAVYFPYYYYVPRLIALDVTLIRLQDGAAIGLEVRV